MHKQLCFPTVMSSELIVHNCKQNAVQYQQRTKNAAQLEYQATVVK